MSVNLFKTRYILAESYLLILLASYIFQSFISHETEAIKYEKEISLDSYTINYLEIDPTDQLYTSPVVLFPDIYYGPEYLLPLAEKLSLKRRVIIPIYTKKSGNSSRKMNNTISEKSRTAYNLIQALQIDSVHVAGQGYGGAVASRFIHDYSESGKSLILLSGMGVQELHFLGNHTLNTILFSILKPLTWIFEYLIPHFGWYYSQPIDQEFASNLAQIDIREHRELMREIEIPVKIIHAADDRYIPVQAAREHFRIIPQSELSLVAGFHNSIFENPGEWFSEINTFIDHVDLDNGITKHDASLKRINESEQPFDRTRITPFTGWVYFIILCLIGLTTIINEDIACIGAGLLAARGLIGFWDALMACLIGIFIFDVMIYWIGRTLGSKAIRKAPFKWFIKEEDIKKAETMFELRGMEILFAAKFIPGTRFPTYFSAGLLKSNFLLFLLYFMVSVIIWAPIVIGISLFAGQTLLTFFQTYQDYFAIIAVGGGIIIYLIVKFLLPVFTVKGRRKLVEKWRRKR